MANPCGFATASPRLGHTPAPSGEDGLVASRPGNNPSGPAVIRIDATHGEELSVSPADRSFFRQGGMGNRNASRIASPSCSPSHGRSQAGHRSLPEIDAPNHAALTGAGGGSGKQELAAPVPGRNQRDRTRFAPAESGGIVDLLERPASGPDGGSGASPAGDGGSGQPFESFGRSARETSW